MAESRLDLLRQMEKDLLQELEQVRALMRSYEPTADSPTKHTQTPKKGKKERVQVKAEGKGRGTQTWEKYTQTVLLEIGGEGKTQDAIAYAIKANPREPESRIIHAIRSKLSKLYRKGVIGARPGGNKKDGYTYFIKDKETSLFNAAA